jgi:hypothetical protein
LLGDENVLGLEVAVVDVFVEEVRAASGELEEERDGLVFRDVAVLLEIAFEVAA